MKPKSKQAKVEAVSGGNKGTAGKVQRVMHEFKEGDLRSGQGKGGKPGPKVKDRAQAVAIAMHEAGMGKLAGTLAHRGKGGRGK